MSKRLISVLVALIMVIGLMPAVGATGADISSQFSDMPNNWATEALEFAVANHLLQGANGKIMPDKPLTRAEMATIIVRAFGASEEGDISSYTDVRKSDWFFEYIAKAFKMGVMEGYSGKMNPDSNITREQAFTVLARALKLQPATRISKTFSDIEEISDWARGSIYALVNAGYIQGSNGKLNPKADITRAEFAQVMFNLIKQYISEEGEYTEVAEGNVMINVPGATLKGLTVSGDLIIGDGVGDGDVVLDDVVVTGRLVIRGGGENSIIIRGNSNVSYIVAARVDGTVRILVEDDAEVEVIYVDDGSDDIIVEGNVGQIEIVADNVTVLVTGASIGSANITGVNSRIIVDADSEVESISVRAANASIDVEGSVNEISTSGANTNVTGGGKVDKVNVEQGGNGASITTPNTEISVGENVTGVTAGGGEEVEGGQTVKNNKDGTGIVSEPPASGGTYVPPVIPDEPAPEVKGSIERDPANTGGELEVTIENDTVTFTSGVIKWYPEDKDLGRAAGNRVGVQINAPADFDTTGVTVKIGEQTYNWDEIKDGDGYFWWYPLVTQAGQQFTATVVWNESSTQEFKVVIGEGVTLEPAPDTTPPVLVEVTPPEGDVVLDHDETFVWTVQASDENLYELEVDHNIADLPEFSVYASAENPYGTDEDKAAFEQYGVEVTYNAAEQKWTIDFGKAVTDKIVAKGGITFYLVIKDEAGNQWGSMYDVTDENTFSYTITQAADPVQEALDRLVAELDMVVTDVENGFNARFDKDYIEVPAVLSGYKIDVLVELEEELPADARVTILYNGKPTAADKVAVTGTEIWLSDLVLGGEPADFVSGDVATWTVLISGNDDDVTVKGTIKSIVSSDGFDKERVVLAEADFEIEAKDSVAPEFVSVDPEEGNVDLTYNESFVWKVKASDKNLYELEVDHNIAELPEFSVYASADDPYGGQDEAFAQAGVVVTYDEEKQEWTIDFGPTVTDKIVEKGGITFYLVLVDDAGNKWGSMDPTTPENTFAYNVTQDKVPDEAQFVWDVNRIEGEGNMSEKLSELGNTAYEALEAVQKVEVAKLFIINRPEEGFANIEAIEIALGEAISQYNGLLGAVNEAEDVKGMKDALQAIGTLFEIDVTDLMAQAALAKRPDEGYASVSAIIAVIQDSIANVGTLEEFKAALADASKTVINLTADFTTTEKILVSRDDVTINGNNKTITFTGDETGWQGNYVLHVYKATGVTIKDIKLTGGDAALLVNGSEVTLTGAIDVSGNEFGGIESSKGVGVGTNPKLTVTDATFTNTTEAYGLPTIWEDQVEGTVVTNEGQFTVSKTVREGQVQYYLDAENAVDPNAHIANVKDLEEFKAALADASKTVINLTADFMTTEK